MSKETNNNGEEMALNGKVTKKSFVNRVLVGIAVGILMVGMVVMASFDLQYPFLRAIVSVIISVLLFLSVIEMRRALGKERIPDDFSWIIWSYGIGFGIIYALFGFIGVILFTMMVFAAAAITALKKNKADCLMYIAFMLVYPGLFMACLLYINKCASTQPIAENSELFKYVINDVWTYLGAKRSTQLLPYNAIGLAFVFAVSAFTDVFAFFFGVLFGKRKLLPEVSPKKTVEGSIGGIFGGLFGSLLVFFLFDYFKIFGEGRGLTIHGLSTANLIISYVAIGLIGSVLTQIGDLLASMIKRNVGIKDYSHILGEHGGIMDRFDGIMLNASFVAFVYMFII